MSLRHPFPALVSCSVSPPPVGWCRAVCRSADAALFGSQLAPGGFPVSRRRAVCRSVAGLSRLPSSLPASRAPGPFRRPLLRLSLRQPRPERLHDRGQVPPPGIVGRCLPGANQGPTAPGNVRRCLPGANKGPTAPGNVRRCLPGANQGPTAPGNEENRLPGAKRPVFAPGREETGSPGAEIGQCAPGSAKRLVAGNGGKQGGRADGLSRARVFPKGPISARGKHGHPAGLFCRAFLFPTTYLCPLPILPPGRPGEEA